MINFFGFKIKGICSICSANEFVIRAALRRALEKSDIILIESTSNQVDQFGGYTGMNPQGFVTYVSKLAESVNFSPGKIIFGGDHLGPNTWQGLPAEKAMQKAIELVSAYVKAGYTKIHLDTSMLCSDDPRDKHGRLPVRTIAERAARLCQAAEEVSSGNTHPHYVIGTDVPTPGGAMKDLQDIEITPVREVEETIEITREAFFKRNLNRAWERILAVVVQPGVEFSDTTVIAYDRNKAAKLTACIKNYKNLFYEAHSTDYQSKHALRQMVEDHFAILKVGPWLTFAFREAVFALSAIENELFSMDKKVKLSDLPNVMETQMIKNSAYWQKHYKGGENELRLARKYSFSDRIRYYWPDPQIARALKRLIGNLSQQVIPMNLLSQFMPLHHQAIIDGRIGNSVKELIDFSINRVLDIYGYATSG